jgi:cytoskeletal protein CcmA (bactofilin family)
MTNLGATLTISGDIFSREDMVVHGTVKGTITMEQGALVVERTGAAVANLQGSRITVHGAASGVLLASGLIRVDRDSQGRRHDLGSLAHPPEGTVFNGNIEVWSQGAKRAQKAS